MRKLLLVSVISCIGLVSAKAQIVITSADMPQLNTMQIKAQDTLTAVLVGNADTAQVWDFTAVTEHTRDTSVVMTYSDFPNSLFSTANTVVSQGNSGFYGYLINSSTSFSLIGGSGIVDVQGTPTAINQTSDQPEILFQFPASYDSSFINNFSTDAKFYYGQVVSGLTIDSIHRISSIEKSVHIDASGSLTTQFGGPYDVIRVKEIRISYDTVMAYFFGDWNNVPGGITTTQTITYYWWANGIGTSLATAIVDSNDNVLSFEWLTEFPDTPPVAANATAVDVSCDGQCDGTATVVGRWGTPPYTYSWNTSPAQNTAVATGLCQGSYTVTVTDSTLATTTQTVTLTAPSAPSISLINTTTLSTSAGTAYQWYLGDSLLSGATNMTYTVTQNGSYSVIVTSNGCSDTSASYTYTSIGISEQAINNNISVYPNPANNYITITYTKAVMQPVNINIQNELGQSIKKITLNPLSSPEMVVDISALPKGIYFVCIQDNTFVINKKFIKQ